MELQTILAILAIVATLIAPLITMSPSLGSRHVKINQLLDALGKPGMFIVNTELIQEEILFHTTVLRIQSRFAPQRVSLRMLQIYASTSALTAIFYNTLLAERPYSEPLQWTLLGLSALLLVLTGRKSKALAKEQNQYGEDIRARLEEETKTKNKIVSIEPGSEHRSRTQNQVAACSPENGRRDVAGLFNSAGETGRRFVVETQSPATGAWQGVGELFDTQSQAEQFILGLPEETKARIRRTE